jgi:hypothetical protein
MSNVVRGLAQGLGTAGTSTVGAIGTLTGSQGLQNWASRSEEEMREFYDPQGTAGRIGEGVGRIAGEIGTGIVGGGAGVKAAAKLSPRIAAAMAGASRLKRGAAVAAANAPIDIVQGAKETEGMLLPGRGGAIAENVLLSGAAGALLPAFRAPRQPPASTPELTAGRPMLALPPGPPVRPSPLPTERVFVGAESGPARIVEQVRPSAGPAIPMAGLAEEMDVLRTQGTPEDIARYTSDRDRGVIRSRSGQTFRRPTSIQRALEEAEREAIRAADVPSAAPVTRFPTSFKKVSDEQLRATAVEWQKRLENTIAEANILDETEAVRFYETYGTKRMGYQAAKRMTGSAEDARRMARFSEEQLGRMEELGLTPDDIKTWREASKRLPTVESQFTRLMGELDKRGLSMVDESTDFPFGQNRSGIIAPELLAQGGGAVLGGAVGAGTADFEDPFDVAGRTALGALAGAGLGRLGTRLGSAGGATPTAPTARTGFPERTTPLTDPNIDPDTYANIERMTANEPQMAEGLRETVAGAVGARELGERLPPRGKEVLGRLREAETEDVFRQRVADLYGVNPSDIVARTAKGERVGREGVMRATEEMMESQQAINGISERLRSGLVVDAQEVNRLEALRDVQRQKSYDLFASISTQKTEMGRDLAAMRFGASLSNNPAVWKDRLEELAKRPLSAEEIADVERLAGSQDLAGLTKLGRELRVSTWKEKAITLFKASLLTSPKTHMANLTGNVGMAALRQLRDVPATLADVALATVTGQRSKVLDVGGRWKALQRGAERGIEEAKMVMRGDVPASDKFREIREVNYDNAIANLYTKGIFRSLDASDRVFRNLAFAESLDEQARVIAKNRGLKGEAADRFVNEMRAAPTVEMTADAILAADVATFQQSSGLSRGAMKFREKVNKQIPSMGDLLFPFVKTPSNIAQTIVNYTPLGVAGSQFKSNLKKVVAKTATTSQQRMVAERLGEASTGTALLALGMYLASDDKMTGFFPSDQRTRAKWEAERRMEGAMKVGNEWVQINRISPVGNLLTIGAALNDVMRGDPDLLSLAIGSVAAPLSAVAELPMAQGLSNISEILNPQSMPEERTAAATRLGGGIVSGTIPFSGMLRSAQQAMDPTERESRTENRLESVMRQVGTGIPGVAQQLPARVDPLGRTIERGGTAFERFVSPLPRQTAMTDVDPVQRALAEANSVVGRVARRKGETPEEYAARAQQTGQLTYEMVRRATESPQYAMVDTMNTDRLRRVLASSDIDVNALGDDELRTAYRTLLLDRVIQRAKSTAARRTPFTTPTRTRQLETALTRQR